jgi:hypothetical protein
LALDTGIAIGIVGDAGARANAQQRKNYKELPGGLGRRQPETDFDDGGP